MGEPLDRATIRRLACGKSERDVVVRAEADEAYRARVPALPPIELVAQEAEALPQGACPARPAAAIDLDHRRGELDDSRVEVDRATSGQVVGAPCAMDQ